MTEQEWRERFSKKLKILMKEKNISQRQLAKEIGMTHSAISMYLSGKSTPKNIRVIINLSYALNVSLSELAYFGGPIIK